MSILWLPLSVKAQFFLHSVLKFPQSFVPIFFSWEGGIWKAKWCYGPSFFCSWRGPWPPGPPLYVRLCPRLYICTWLNSKGGGALAHEAPPTLRHCLKASVQLKKLVRALADSNFQCYSLWFLITISWFLYDICVIISRSSFISWERLNYVWLLIINHS